MSLVYALAARKSSVEKKNYQQGSSISNSVRKLAYT